MAEPALAYDADMAAALTAAVAAAKGNASIAANSNGVPSHVPAAAVDGRGYEFDEDFQTKIAALAIRDSTFAQRADGLVRPEFFVKEAEAQLVKIAGDYFSKYRKAPDRSTFAVLIRDAVAAKRIRKDMIDDVKATFKALHDADLSDREFCLDKVGEFARHRAVEEAMVSSITSLQGGDFKTIEKLMRTALDVGASDEGIAYDYFDEIRNRTQIRKEIAAGVYKHDGISTGHPELDKYLYHRGWGRKELSVIMGPPKGGKSLSLGEFGKNAALLGKNVLYVTLEVSASIIADRLDANIADTLMKDLTSTPFDVQKKIEAMHARSGVFKIHEYPSGTFKPSQLRRLLERYRGLGTVFDLVIVDYADIMAPEFRNDVERENSKSIYIDLRAIAWEYGCAMLTATQTNRDGAKSQTAKATDVSEDINKIRIADIVLSLNATDTEKAAGEARIFFAAVRNGEDGFSLLIKQDRAKMKFLTKILARV